MCGASDERRVRYLVYASSPAESGLAARPATSRREHRGYRDARHLRGAQGGGRRVNERIRGVRDRIAVTRSSHTPRLAHLVAVCWGTPDS